MSKQINRISFSNENGQEFNIVPYKPFLYENEEQKQAFLDSLTKAFQIVGCEVKCFVATSDEEWGRNTRQMFYDIHN